MIKGLSRIISIIFHPLLMPLVGIYLIFNSENPASLLDFQYQKFVYLMALVCMVLLPICILPFFMYKRLINSVEMETARERTIPFVVTCLLYYVAYLLISNLDVSLLLSAFLFSSFVTVFFVAVISFFWKISAHLAALGGISGEIIFISEKYSVDLQIFLIFIFIIAGLTGSARLQLNAHKPSQIYAGFGVGVLSVMITMLIYFCC